MSNPTLNNLTIIIFSFNRHKWLKRIISYWSNYSVKLLVLDGSDKRLEDQYLSAKILNIFMTKEVFMNVC